MPTKAEADSAQLQRKASVIDEIRTRLGSADAAVLTEYRGLTVAEIANLRAALRPAATDYKVFKNTLARRAAEDAGFADLVEHLEGPVAIAFVRKDGGDAVTAAKALRDFARGNPNLVVKGGILGGRVLSTDRGRSAGRRAAARRAARPPGRRLPRAAHEGGRAVPGLHPQLRLRPQGLHRPARRAKSLPRRQPRRSRSPSAGEVRPAESPKPPPSVEADSDRSPRSRRPESETE